MKGTLHKTEMGWVISHWIQDPFYKGPAGTTKKIVEILPLHPDETDMDCLNPIPEGKEVDFEIKEKYIEPEGIHCNRGYDKKYATIIDPEESWESIQDKAAKDGVDIPINWFKERNYTVPTINNK